MSNDHEQLRKSVSEWIKDANVRAVLARNRIEAELRQRVVELSVENDTLQAERDRLRDALAWYASPEAWTVAQVEGPDGDYGKRARAALGDTK